MNLTLSVDDTLLKRARRLAARRGISLDQMIGDYLAQITDEACPDDLVAELDLLWAQSRGASKGRRFNRKDLHDRAKRP